MPRFFVSMPLIAGTSCSLPEPVARHIQVLRLQSGDPITLFNGEGGEYNATHIELGKKHAFAQLDGFLARELETPYRLTLAQGIAGGDKMDWLIEKAVELGVTSVVPLTAERGVVRLSGDRASRRQVHWQALVRAACEQCGRNRVPDVMAPQDLEKWLGSLPPAQDGELRLLLSPRAQLGFASLPASAPAAPVTVAIGPEAGFS